MKATPGNGNHGWMTVAHIAVKALCSGLILLSFSHSLSAGEHAVVGASYSAQIAALRSNAKVKLALDHARSSSAQTIQELIRITEIEAPPFQEHTRAKYFAKLLRQAGLEVNFDEVGNVIGRRKGQVGDRLVAYTAHLDTVFPPGTDVSVTKEQGRLLAPGIGDNSRGLITVLEVLRALQFAGIKTQADLLFIGNVGEEGLGDLRGVKHLFRDGAEKIDAMIAIDGGSAERIVFGGVGSHRYRVSFNGVGGHSWGAFGMANPHHALGRAMAIFVERAPSITLHGKKTSYNIGRIGGGTSINSIPFQSWMEVDMRSVVQSKLEELDAVFQGAMNQALEDENAQRQLGPEITMEVKRVGLRPAVVGDPNIGLVQRALAATESFGLKPSLELSSTDANTPLSKGIPAVTMSRGGRSGRAHSLDEWWQDEESYVSVQIGILTLLAEAGLAEAGNDGAGEVE